MTRAILQLASYFCDEHSGMVLFGQIKCRHRGHLYFITREWWFLTQRMVLWIWPLEQKCENKHQFDQPAFQSNNVTRCWFGLPTSYYVTSNLNYIWIGVAGRCQSCWFCIVCFGHVCAVCFYFGYVWTVSVHHNWPSSFLRLLPALYCVKAGHIVVSMLNCVSYCHFLSSWMCSNEKVQGGGSSCWFHDLLASCFTIIFASVPSWHQHKYGRISSGSF